MVKLALCKPEEETHTKKYPNSKENLNCNSHPFHMYLTRKHDRIHEKRQTTLFQNSLNHQTNKVKSTKTEQK